MAKKTSTKPAAPKKETKTVVQKPASYKPANGELCKFSGKDGSFLGTIENGEVIETYVIGGCQITRPRGKASDYTAKKASKDDISSIRRL